VVGWGGEEFLKLGSLFSFWSLLLFCYIWLFANIYIVYKYIWATSWQNQHSVFASSMDPDQPAISFSNCNRIGKRTAWILIRLRGCAGWSQTHYVGFVMGRLIWWLLSWWNQKMTS
jgi:hypothetical protein